MATAVVASAGALTLIEPATSAQAASIPATFTSDGTWTVPAGVTSIDIYAGGGAGGREPGCTKSAFGATVKASFRVTPGTVLDINIGGVGGSPSQAVGGLGGANGGGRGGNGPTLNGVATGSGGAGGGGASDVRIGGSTLTKRVLVAGGGGGGGITEPIKANECTWSSGGWGGQPVGMSGSYTYFDEFGNNDGGHGGGGGTATRGGFVGFGGAAASGTAGRSGFGGNGGPGAIPGGGGGGGFYGGGGGGACLPSDEVWCPADYAGGGGGGSSYVLPTATKKAFGLNGAGKPGFVTISRTPPPPPAPTTPRNNCVVIPTRIASLGTATLLKPNCLTYSNQQIRVKAMVTGVPVGPRYVAFTCRRPGFKPVAATSNTLGAWCGVGSLTIATLTGKKLNLLLTWRSAGTTRSLPYYAGRAYLNIS